MLNKMTQLLAASILAASVTNVANAANIDTATDSNTSTGTITRAVQVFQKGLVPYLGLSAGYLDSDTDVYEGTPSAIKLLGSYYFQDSPWVADAGLGILNQKFTARDNATINVGSLEASARYRLANNWQAGAVINTFSGGTQYFGSSSNNYTHFVGGTVKKEFTMARNTIARVGGRLMADVSTAGSMLNLAMVDLEIGWKPEAASASVPIAAVVPYSTQENKADLSVFIKNEGINFELGKATLDSQRNAYMRRLSRVLAVNSSLFQKVEVVGHADQTGPERLNLDLSKDRAVGVARQLARAGLTQDKILTTAKGFSEPLINSLRPEALQQNRRVELKFYGVKNVAQLESLLNSL